MHYRILKKGLPQPCNNLDTKMYFPNTCLTGLKRKKTINKPSRKNFQKKRKTFGGFS